jgi:hypothetical protein
MPPEVAPKNAMKMQRRTNSQVMPASGLSSGPRRFFRLRACWSTSDDYWNGMPQLFGTGTPSPDIEKADELDVALCDAGTECPAACGTLNPNRVACSRNRRMHCEDGSTELSESRRPLRGRSSRTEGQVRIACSQRSLYACSNGPLPWYMLYRVS